MDGVLTGLTMFHEQNIELVKAKVIKVLKDNDESQAVISETSTIFKCPFDDLKMEYKYLKKHLSLLVSQ